MNVRARIRSADTVARIRALGAFVRRLTGDDAYERYLAHARARHPELEPMSAAAFYREREAHKWSGVKRCC